MAHVTLNIWNNYLFFPQMNIYKHKVYIYHICSCDVYQYEY